ncbi:MAG: glycosyltransferase family 4 protein [Armatimonadota bacterium]|nr:glycosyltransferase family 4 protein [Armatimonadota bacterium]
MSGFYRLVILEIWCPDLTTAAGVEWYRYELGRDFPWVLEDDRIVVEAWGLRRRPGASEDPKLGARGPVVPWNLPAPIAVPLAWLAHRVLALTRRGPGVFVAPTPYSAVGIAGLGSRRAGPALVVRVQGNPASKQFRVRGRRWAAQLLRRLERAVLRRASLVVPMGRFTRHLAQAAGVPSERIVELPFPTSWRETVLTPGRKSPNPLVTCAARLVPEKGVDMLLRAWGRVVQAIPQAVLEVAGDGPERARLEGMASRLGLEDRVRFLGWVASHDMPQLYRRAWAVVLPSRWEEGLGMCLVEGGLAGCALVGTDLGGIREIVRPGRNGTLVPPEDPEALARALEGLLSRPAVAAAYGQAAREDALAYLGRREEALIELQRRMEELLGIS